MLVASRPSQATRFRSSWLTAARLQSHSEPGVIKMSSRRKGSDITAQEAIDLLHKLSTESTRVVAVLSVSPRIHATVFGKVKVAQDDTLWVIDDELRVPPLISFDPLLAVRRTYGDDRTMPTFPERAPENWPRFESALCFLFPDGASICLFAERSE